MKAGRIPIYSPTPADLQLEPSFVPDSATDQPAKLGPFRQTTSGESEEFGACNGQQY